MLCGTDYIPGVSAFRSDRVLPSILKRLLSQDIVRLFTLEEVQARNHTLYRANVPASLFTLVIEGHMEVEVGKDGMKFEAGPFHYFGMQALEMASSSGGSEYVPDFTVHPTSDCLVMVITCKQYLDACKASLFQQTKDHDSSLGLLNHNNHPSHQPDAATSPTTVKSSTLRSTKSASQLKSPMASTTKKSRPSKDKRGKKLEVQHLLADSLSEDDEGYCTG